MWVALALALAASLAGWALTKVDSLLPGWAPQAAFVIAGCLVLVAICLGVFGGAPRRRRLKIEIANSWIGLAKEIFAATRSPSMSIWEPMPHDYTDAERRRHWDAQNKLNTQFFMKTLEQKRERFQQRIAVAAKQMEDLGVPPPRPDITIVNDFCLEVWAKALAGEGEKILSGRPWLLRRKHKPFTPPPSPGDPDF